MTLLKNANQTLQSMKENEVNKNEKKLTTSKQSVQFNDLLNLLINQRKVELTNYKI